MLNDPNDFVSEILLIAIKFTIHIINLYNTTRLKFIAIKMTGITYVTGN
jgi:hypothetical protein